MVKKKYHHRSPSSGGDVVACRVADVALPPSLQLVTTCVVVAADGDYYDDGYHGGRG